jgi:hypothetical protein
VRSAAAYYSRARRCKQQLSARLGREAAELLQLESSSEKHSVVPAAPLSCNNNTTRKNI